MEKTNIRALLAWVMVCFVWGTTYLAIKIGVAELPPMLFAGLRWILSSIIFIPILLLKGYKLPHKSEFKHIAVVGILLIGVANGLVVVGEQWLPSGLTALLITSMPFWAVSIETFIVFKKRPHKKVIIGLMMGVTGVGIIFGGDLQYILDPGNLTGVICILTAMLAWASGSVYSQNVKINTHPLMAAAIQMIIAGTAQTLMGGILGEFSRLQFTEAGVYSFVYLAIVGSIFGYGSYIYAIKHLPVSFVATYTYINPVIALFLGWFVLDETIGWNLLIGAVIIISGVAVVRSGTAKKPAVHKV